MKMLVSRKYLPLIHFFAGIRTAGINVFEALTKGAMGCQVALANVRLEPLAEGGVEGGVFGFGDLAGFFDQIGVGAESDILHWSRVHDDVYTDKCARRVNCRLAAATVPQALDSSRGSRH